MSPTIYSVYVDGSLAGFGATGTSDGLLYDSNHRLRIGDTGFGGGYVEVMNGQIDEVRIWSTARSAWEIQANMHRSLTGSDPGLMGYWQFDEGNGPTAADASRHGFTGTLVNGPAWVTSTAPVGTQPLVGPPLQIAGFGHSVLIWWPTNAPGFTLEDSVCIGTNQNWRGCKDSILVIGDQNVAAAEATGGAKLFRLRGQ